MKKAFTLAEVMIVLAIIGILTAILLPVAHNATPNENILKFKKAHNTLYTAIRELVNSDKYYSNGDLGIKPDGTLIDGTHEGDAVYFCNTLYDMINAKKKECIDTGAVKGAWVDFSAYDNEIIMQKLDSGCLSIKNTAGVITFDGIVFSEQFPKVTYGMSIADAQINANYPAPVLSATKRNFGDYLVDGFDVIYKIFCIDIDGINQGEDPFGYGIRADGKIVNGARAEEWLQKTIQEK